MSVREKNGNKWQTGGTKKYMRETSWRVISVDESGETQIKMIYIYTTANDVQSRDASTRLRRRVWIEFRWESINCRESTLDRLPSRQCTFSPLPFSLSLSMSGRFAPYRSPRVIDIAGTEIIIIINFLQRVGSIRKKRLKKRENLNWQLVLATSERRLVLAQCPKVNKMGHQRFAILSLDLTFVTRWFAHFFPTFFPSEHKPRV